MKVADISERRFGRRMRQERERAGLTRLQLSERIRELGVDLHQSAVAKMEDRDTAKPRAIRLAEAAAIASVLGISVSDMMAPQTAELARLTDQARDIVADNNRAMASWRDLESSLTEVADEASAEGNVNDEQFGIFMSINDQMHAHLIDMARALMQAPGGAAILRRTAAGEIIDPNEVAKAPWLKEAGDQ